MHSEEAALVDAALACGADGAAVIDAGKIPYRRKFRLACEQNACGQYGRNWMCPPDVGGIDALIASTQVYGRALVFNTVSPLEDSFDFAGMMEAEKRHTELGLRIAKRVLPLPGGALRLGAGACLLCAQCAKIDGAPCRRPDDAVSSLEAYGVAVSELAPLCGMNYINGENTVTFFGAILFGRVAG